MFGREVQQFGGEFFGSDVVVDSVSNAVSLKAMVDVELLLEVSFEGCVEKRDSGCGQLHRGGEASLDNSNVAGGQHAVEVGHPSVNVE